MNATQVMAASNSTRVEHAPERIRYIMEGYWATTSGWQIAATVLLLLVAYDQCKQKLYNSTVSEI